MSGIYTIGLILIGPIVYRKLASITNSRQRTFGFSLTLLPDLSSPTSILSHLLVLLNSVYRLYQLISSLINPATSDLFKSSFSINQSTSSIRSTLLSLDEPPQSLLPLTSLGLPSNHQDVQSLQLLLERLSRFEGRIIYLLVGSEPILDCVYCVKRDDFIFYKLFNNVLISYITTLLLIGFLSISFKSGQNLDSIVRFVGISKHSNNAKQKQKQSQTHFKDSKKSRTWSICFIAAGFMFEAFTLLTQATIATNGGWMNHYNYNLSLFRNLHFFILPILILIFQTERALPAHQRTLIKLEVAEHSLREGILEARAGRVGRELKEERSVGKQVKDGARVNGDNHEEGQVGLPMKKFTHGSQASNENSEKTGSQTTGSESTSDSDPMKTQHYQEPSPPLLNETTIPPLSSTSSSSQAERRAQSTSSEKAPAIQSNSVSADKMTLEQLLSRALQAKISPQALESMRKQCDEVANKAWEASNDGQLEKIKRSH